MLKYAEIRWNTMKYDEIRELCWVTLSYVELRWTTLNYFEIHWNKLKYVEIYWNALEHVEIRWNTFKYVFASALFPILLRRVHCAPMLLTPTGHLLVLHQFLDVFICLAAAFLFWALPLLPTSWRFDFSSGRVLACGSTAKYGNHGYSLVIIGDRSVIIGNH